MSIWEFLGFGVNHKRMSKYNQQAIEQQNMRIKRLCMDINIHGITELLKKNRYDVKDIKAVLNHFKEPPIDGDEPWVQKNWKEAQQWFYEQEHPELKKDQNELKEMKKKMQEMEEKIAKYEKENNK